MEGVGGEQRGEENIRLKENETTEF